MNLVLSKIFRSLLLTLIAALSFQAVYAQNNTDSIKAARQRAADSTRDAQKQYSDSVNAARKASQDSIRTAQKHISDSIKAERVRVADSIASVRSYLQSKAYNDSVDLARQRRLDSMQRERQRVNDSLAAERQRVNDSTAAARQRYNDSMQTALAAQRAEQQRIQDSIATVRQHTADSMAAINAYRQSDRYKDSTAAIRKQINDSVTAVRKAYNDSLRTAQQHMTDSINTARQKYNDSLKVALDQQRAERQKYMDSMTVVRQARTDSLAKAKEIREANKKVREKKKKDKLKLALELKIKKKQDAYTNETMRKKKWTLSRQLVQNTFTRYNYYFNADKKMQEAEANIQRAIKDNYDSLLPLFIFNPDRDSGKVVSDMDTIIQKASIGIQLHDPRGKWEDDLYMLVGKAYYYKGDYKNAAAAYKYIIAQAQADQIEKAKKENKGKKAAPIPLELGVADKTGIAGMLEHRTSKNEAMLALAQTFTQSGQDGQAQSLLDMLGNDQKFPERLHGGIALQQAFINLKNEDYDNALKSLVNVADDNEIEKSTRERAAFLCGQLYQRQGNNAESEKYFNKVIDMKPPFEMDFYSQMNIANNNLKEGGDYTSAASTLQKMAGDGKYQEFYDQIYYGLGKLALNNKNTDDAINNFRKSIRFSQSNKKQKGLSFAALGEVYYGKGNYKDAKKSYDSASMFLTATDEPEFTKAQKFATTLAKIAGPATEIQQLDSLLHLSSLSEKEQRGEVRKYIREQEKLLRDSVFVSQNAAVPVTNNIVMNNNAAGQWYFANASLMQQGSNEFKQKWGNRPLKDNWRRSSNSFDNNTGEANEDENDEQEDLTPDNLNEDSLMAAIPHTNEQIAKVNSRLMEAYFSLGKSYYSELEDFPDAIATYDKLDAKYPENPHQDEVLYHRYMMALRQNDAAKIASYNAALQSKFPESAFAKTLRNAAAGNGASDNGKTIAQHYDETYGLLMKKEYADVIAHTEEVENLYPAQAGRYAKQYNLLKAVAIAGQGNYPKADTILSEFLKSNPSDSLAPWANDVLNYIKKQSGNSITINTAIPKTDTAAVAPPMDTTDMKYVFNPAQKQYVLICAAALDGKLMGLKSGLNDYNSLKHSADKPKINITSLQDGRGIIVLKEFATIAAAKSYIAEIKQQKDLFKEYAANETEIMLISPENLNVLYQKNNYDTYKQFYGKNYK